MLFRYKLISFKDKPSLFLQNKYKSQINFKYWKTKMWFFYEFLIIKTINS